MYGTYKDANIRRISDVLDKGKEHAQKWERIADEIGANGARQFRQAVSEERQAGVPVVAAGHGSYYIADLSRPREREELIKCLKPLHTSALSTIAMIRAVIKVNGLNQKPAPEKQDVQQIELSDIYPDMDGSKESE